MNLLLVHLGSVAVLAIAVEVACRLGRFRPAVCHALWLVVLIKLVVPPLVAWPVTADAINVTQWSSGGAAGVAAIAPRDPVARGSFAESGVVPETTAVESAAPVTAPPTRTLTLQLLLAVWVAGGLAVAVRITVQIVRVRRRIAVGTPLPPWLHAQLETACATLGVPVPRAVVVGDPGGIHMQIAGRPVLVVSEDSLAHVAPEGWHTVLTHELAHLKRRDHWVAWCVLAAGVLWWWNPCFWWARHRIHLFSEMACDAWVVHVHPEDRKTYAETMVQVMAMLSRQDATAPAMGLAAWSATTQERRLWMIMKAKGRCTVSGVYAAALTGLAVLISPAWIAVGADDPASAEATEKPAAETGWKLSLEPTEDLQVKLETRVNIEFEDIHVKDTFEFIQDSFDINVVLDQRVVAPEPDPEADVPPEKPAGGDAYVTGGMVPYINLKDTPLKEALVALITPLNLTYQMRGDAVWISSAKQLALDQAIALPSADFSEGDILAKLGTAVNIEFEDIHLKDVFEFIQDSFEINVVIDSRVVMPEGGDWNSPPLGSPGYATDGFLGYIHLKDCPLSEAIYTVTRLTNLTYTVKENYVFISTPELIDKDAPEGYDKSSGEP